MFTDEECAAICDLLNIYLRENGATEIVRPSLIEIKAGIDRLAEAARVSSAGF